MTDNHPLPSVVAYKCELCGAIAFAVGPGTPPATSSQDCGACAAAGRLIGRTLSLVNRLTTPANPATAYVLTAVLVLSEPPAGIIVKPREVVGVAVQRVFSHPDVAARWLTGVMLGENGTRATVQQAACIPSTVDDVRALDGVEIPAPAGLH